MPRHFSHALPRFAAVAKRVLFGLCAWSVLTVTVVVAAPPRYKLIDLGTLGGPVSQPSDINNAGQITGRADLNASSYHAFLSNQGAALQDLGTLGGQRSQGYSINDLGQIVGSSQLADNATDHAFLYANGVLQDLGTLGGATSVARGINNAGAIVGTSAPSLDSTATHAFLRPAGGGALQDLGTLGGTSSFAFAINASGQIVGYSNYPGSASNVYRAFLYANGAMQDLGVLPGGSVYSTAVAINDAGQIVGSSTIGSAAAPTYRAVIYSGGGITDLGALLPVGYNSNATGINNSGQVVGRYSNSVDLHVFLYSGGTMYDLADLVVDGGNFRTVISAAQINDDGSIIGFGYRKGDSNNNNVAFLAVPTTLDPFPVTYEVTDLGTLGGDASRATAINNQNQIVGFSTAAGSVVERAAAFAPGGAPTDLGVRASGAVDEIAGLNDAGQIALAVPSDSLLESTAVLLTLAVGGPPARLDLPGFPNSAYNVAQGVNAKGVAVGWAFTVSAFDQRQRAVVFEDGDATDLGSLGGYNSVAYGINKSGQVAGYSEDADGVQHAALFSVAGGQPVDLTADKPEGAAYAVNDAGQIVGYQRSYNATGFLLSRVATLFTVGADGAVATTDLRTKRVASFQTGAISTAYGINKTGDVVGEVSQGTFNTFSRAFYYTGGTLYDLNLLAADHLGGFTTLDVARGINDAGWIVGEGTINGQTHAFLARPLGGPAAHAPVLATAPGGQIIAGEAFAYQIVTDGSVPVEAYAASGLPAGLTVNATTGLISGMVPVDTAAGEVSVNVSATNAGGTGNAALTFTVVAPPVGKAADLTGAFESTKAAFAANGKFTLKGKVTLANAGTKTANKVPVGVYLSHSPTFSFPLPADPASARLLPLAVKLVSTDAAGDPIPPVLKVTAPASSTAATLATLPVKLATAGKAAATYTTGFKLKAAPELVQTASSGDASAGGYRYLLIVADPQAAFAEPAKTNNVAAFDLQTAQP